MGRFAPTTQPTAVTTDATIVEIPLGPPRATRRLERLVVEYVSGDCTSFTAEWSTDSTVADKTKSIVDLTGGTTTVPLDVLAPHDHGFAWDAPRASSIYVKVDPNAGVNNAFRVAAYLEE